MQTCSKRRKKPDMKSTTQKQRSKALLQQAADVVAIKYIQNLVM